MPLLCMLLGHKWRLPRGFYTIGEEVTERCARKDCGASQTGPFYIERL